ncbi:hypothetical protein [Klebsiella pneumoniae]|uniref:hypothetical protein n=1 Tax=Klebsiella pneumoniae TaxID=573 RepID=UPI00192CAA14|nr:hypothetical protein [Klebsiella pneumoniae]MBL4373337.1 hypothetical protein [Klebsiella pneumoniae]
MERRDFAKRLALMVGAGAAGAVSSRVSAAEERSQVQQLYSPQQLHDTVNVLKFGTQENASDAFYKAFIYLNKRGGGNLLVPNGNYIFDKPVKTRIGCKISVYTSSNSIMTMKSDGDMFDITGSENAAIRFFGNGEFIYDGPATSNAACIRFVSLTNGKKYATSSFECNGRIRIRKGGNEWAYGIHLTDVRDGILVGLQIDGLNRREAPSRQIGISINSHNSPSVSWVINNMQINDVDTAYDIKSDSTPGVEGLKFFNCDMGGVRRGIFYNNTTEYMPPQIEIVGCHINGRESLISINRAVSVHILGGLLYKNGINGNFIDFNGVSDVSIVGITLTVIGEKSDSPGIYIKGSATEPSGLIRVSDCNYWAHGKKSPFIVLSGTIFKFGISNTMKDSIGKMLDLSELHAEKSTITIDRDTVKLTALEKGESWGVAIDNHSGVVDLTNTIPGVVYLKSNKISSIKGALLNVEYTLVSTSGILEISKNDDLIESGRIMGVAVKFFFDGDKYIFV